MNFSIEYPETPNRRQFQNSLFSLTVQPVRVNNLGAPLLGLAKSIYIIAHAQRACGKNPTRLVRSFGLPLTMNGMNRTHFEPERVSSIVFVISVISAQSNQCDCY